MRQYIGKCYVNVSAGQESSYSCLHDTMEDTDTREEEITQFFGDRVLRFVLEFIDDKSCQRKNGRPSRFKSDLAAAVKRTAVG